MAAVCRVRARVDSLRCSTAAVGCRGPGACRRRRGPEGLRAAGGGRRARVPRVNANQLPAGAAPRCCQRAYARRWANVR